MGSVSPGRLWPKPAPTPPRRRDEILTVAAVLFAERGFLAVTVEEIGAALNISGPALYHHFRSKEALLGEMLVGISEHLVEEATRITAEERDPLWALLDHHVSFAVDDPSLITVQYRDLIHASDADQAKVKRLQRRYVELWVQALGADEDLRIATARVHATFGLLNSTPHSARLAKADMKEMLRAMAHAALTAVTLDSGLSRR